MARKRVSIKGIGATIFYDSEQPLLDLMRRATAKMQNEEGMFEGYDGVEDLDPHDLALLDDVEIMRESPDAQTAWVAEATAPLEGEPLWGEETGDVSDDDEPDPNGKLSASSTANEQPAQSGEETLSQDASQTATAVENDEMSSDGWTDAAEDVSAGAAFDADVEEFEPTSAARNASATRAVQARSGSTRVTGRPDVLAGLLRWEQTDELTYDDPVTLELIQQVDVLYDRVAISMSTNIEAARLAMDLLHEARGLLASGEPRDVHAAERRLNEVKARLHQVERIGRWSQTYGWGLFVYEILFILAFLAALVYDRNIASWLGSATASGLSGGEGLSQIPKAISAAYPPWSSMLWGGLGGAVAAIFSLQRHVAELSDFDRRYTVSYLIQPFSGMMLGSVVYLIMAILLGLAGLMSGASGDAHPGELASYWIPSLIACLAGFRQKYAFDIVEKFLPSSDDRTAK